jgi:hypothetical protein
LLAGDAQAFVCRFTWAAGRSCELLISVKDLDLVTQCIKEANGEGMEEVLFRAVSTSTLKTSNFNLLEGQVSRRGEDGDGRSSAREQNVVPKH